MIDNRPKSFPKKDKPQNNAPVRDAIPVEVHSSSVMDTPLQSPPRTQVRKKSAAASPIAGLLNGLTNGLGGGLGGVLPVVLAVSALQNNRGKPLGAQAKTAVKQHDLPAVPAEPIAAVPVTAPKTAGRTSSGKHGFQKPNDKTFAETVAKAPLNPIPDPKTGLKQRTQLKVEKKPAEPVAVPVPDPTPVAAPAPRAAAPARPAPKPTDIKNLLSDLTGYLPGSGNASVARISRIIGIADELKSIDNPANTFTSSLPADPLSRHIGLLNALSRNLPITGATHLGKASQVLSMVNTLKGGGGQNLGNMAGMLSGMMGQNQVQSKSAAPEMKNVTPAQADGIKDTVNRLLSGMDDKQKNELLDKAKNFLGKK
jgi:hypothetical protein